MFRRLWFALDRLASSIERLADRFEEAGDDVEFRLGHQGPRQIEQVPESEPPANGQRGRKRVVV
jgi:hypothetical protein